MISEQEKELLRDVFRKTKMFGSYRLRCLSHDQATRFADFLNDKLLPDHGAFVIRDNELNTCTYSSYKLKTEKKIWD